MSKRLFLLALAAGSSAWAQFQDLVTTDDGNALYFSSSLRLKGTKQSFAPKLFVLDTAGLRLSLERPPGQQIAWTYENFYELTAPEVSADGGVLAFTAGRPCTGGSGCLNVERYQANIVSMGKEFTTSGRVTMSRNGRFAVTYGSTTMFPKPETDWSDFTTGEKVRLPYDVSGVAHRRIASDGTVVLTDPNGKLVLWRKSGTQTLANGDRAEAPQISDDAARIVYEAVSADGHTRRLVSYDVKSGKESELYPASAVQSFGATISGSGSTVAFLAPANTGLQIYVADAAGTRPVAGAPEGATAVALSGDGQTLYAATGTGRLLKITGGFLRAAELIPRTPQIRDIVTGQPWVPGVAPGSLVRLTGSGFSDIPRWVAPPLPDSLGDLRVLVGGLAAPVYVAAPDEVWYQVRWSTPPGDLPFALVTGSSPFETGPGTISVAPVRANFFLLTAPAGQWFNVQSIAIHGDWSGLVTQANPARGGEVINTYMSGLGAVAPAIADGVLAPVDPLPRTINPLVCQFWDGAPHNAEVLYSGLAPYMIGIYQVSLRVPPGLSAGELSLACGDTSGTVSVLP